MSGNNLYSKRGAEELLTEAEAFQLKKVKTQMNKHEWTEALDKMLEESVVRNYFNFDTIAMEVNLEAKALGLNFGATHIFNPEKCRTRWSYIHLKRKAQRPIKYVDYAQKSVEEPMQQSSGESGKENAVKDQNIPEQQKREGESISSRLIRESKKTSKKEEQKEKKKRNWKPSAKQQENAAKPSEPEKEFEASVQHASFVIKKPANSMAEIEENLWKNNITTEKLERVDFLDVGQEDFSQYKEVGEDGIEVTPSSFNIFRDNLKDVSLRMRAKMVESLPDVNLEDGESSANESEEEEVVPLDFRTALMKADETGDQKVVIQAKPMHIKTAEEYLQSLEEEEEKAKAVLSNTSDAFFNAMRKDAFNDQDGEVILIDPGMNLDDRLREIDLPCNLEERINNAIDAPLKPSPAKEKAPAIHKTYESDSEEPKEKLQSIKQAQQTFMSRSKAHMASLEKAKEDAKAAEQNEKVDYDAVYKEELRNIADQFQLENPGLGGQIDAINLAFNANMKAGLHPDREELDSDAPPLLDTLDFNNILSTLGVGGNKLNPFLGLSEEEQEESKDALEQPQVDLSQIEFKLEDEDHKVTKEASDSAPDSDHAPMSPAADTPDPVEEAEREQKRAKTAFETSVKIASSDEESDKEKVKQEEKVAEVKQEKTEIKVEEVKPQESQTIESDEEKRRIEEIKKKNQLYYNGVRLASNQKSSESDDDAGEDYFAQQRELAKQRRLKAMKKKAPEPEPVRQQYSDDSEEERLEQVRKQREAEQKAIREAKAKQEQIQIEKKRLTMEEDAAKRESENRLRKEKIKQQEQQLAKEREKTQRDRDELMEKLKKQDEERKRRKREEKERKEKERREKQKAEDEVQAQKNELERIQMEHERQLADVAHRKKVKEDIAEKNKAQFEESIPKQWNGTDVPCLFESKIAFFDKLSQLPLNLEDQIASGNMSAYQQRYKTMIIPFDDAVLPGEAMGQIVSYFMKNSCMRMSKNGDRGTGKRFPFQLVSMQMTMMQPPFKGPSPNLTGQENLYRVMVLLFDTADQTEALKGKSGQVSFQKVLDTISLEKIFSKSVLSQVRKGFPDFIIKLAHAYKKAGGLEDFPYKMDERHLPMLEFASDNDQFLNNSDCTLNRLCYQTSWLLLKDVIPPTTQSTLELYRRLPQFYSYNPNQLKHSIKKKANNAFDFGASKMPSEKVQNKFNQFEFENVVVVFKEITVGGPIKDASAGPDQPITTCDSSLQYFFEQLSGINAADFEARQADEALEIQGGLQVVSMRTVYLGADQLPAMKDVIGTGENIKSQILPTTEEEDIGGSPYLVMVVRGPEAATKIDAIVGPVNPEISRKMHERNLRAYFGQDRVHNCVLNVHGGMKKRRNLLDLVFWTGGRIPKEPERKPEEEEEKYDDEEEECTAIQNLMYTVVPPPITKHYILVSPLIGNDQLPQVLQRLAESSVTVLDVQKIDFSRLSYEGGAIQNLLRSNCNFQVRGTRINLEVGFMLRVARENLHELMRNVIILGLEEDFQGVLRTNQCQISELLFVSKDKEEYSILKNRINKGCLKVDLFAKKAGDGGTTEEEAEATIKRLSDYDSEDPENFSNLPLYENNSGFGNKISKQGMKQTARNALQLTKQSSAAKPNKFETSTFITFMKPSMFKRNTIGETMQLLTHECGFELLGMRLVDLRKNLFFQEVPLQVQHLFKSVAYKFNQHHMNNEIQMRRKMFSSKTIVLVLRGMDVEQKIDKIYDRETLQFANQALNKCDASAQVVFLTNQQLLKPFFDFILKTKLLYLYHDLANANRYAHLMDSPVFSRLAHNQTLVAPDLYSCANYIEIKKWEHLYVDDEPGAIDLSACVVLVKPNQPLNVAIRTLRTIINSNEEGKEKLRIAKLQIVQYSEEKLQLIYKHDFEYDDSLLPQHKENITKIYNDFFHDKAGQPIPMVQALVTGRHAISKVKQIIGEKDPKLSNATKNTMRSYYGTDRFDNAFFISENFAESLIERDFLFAEEIATGQGGCVVPMHDVVVDKEKKVSPLDLIMQSKVPELCLVVIGPTMVRSGDFIYVMDDINRNKFTICGIRKAPAKKFDMTALFSDQTRNYDLDVMWENEFKPDQEQLENDCIVLVLEKEKAMTELQTLVGRSSIKTPADFEKYKKKQSAYSFGQNSKARTFVEDYGAYVYTFTNAQQNQKKVAHFFKRLLNSEHYKIVHRQLML